MGFCLNPSVPQTGLKDSIQDNFPNVCNIENRWEHTSKSSVVRPNPEEVLYHGDSTPPLHIAEIRLEALFISPPHNTFPDVKVIANTLDTQDVYTIHTLLDSGATASFIDSQWAQKNNLSTLPLLSPQNVFNADGTQNLHGCVTHQVQLCIAVQGHVCLKWFFITNLGKSKKMIIGIDWLKEHNPSIDWAKGSLKFNQCPVSCGSSNTEDSHLQQFSISFMVNIPEDYTEELNTDYKDDYFIYETVSNKLAREALKHQMVTNLDDIKKGPYSDYLNVFSEEGFQELPPY